MVPCPICGNDYPEELIHHHANSCMDAAESRNSENSGRHLPLGRSRSANSMPELDGADLRSYFLPSDCPEPIDANFDDHFAHRGRSLIRNQASRRASTSILKGGKLFLCIEKANNLPCATAFGRVKPFVSIQMDGQTAQTSCRRHPGDAVWNEQFVFDIVEYFGRTSIEIEVFDRVFYGASYPIGTLRIPLRDFFPKHQIEVEHLQSCNRSSYLRGKWYKLKLCERLQKKRERIVEQVSLSNLYLGKEKQKTPKYTSLENETSLFVSGRYIAYNRVATGSGDRYFTEYQLAGSFGYGTLCSSLAKDVAKAVLVGTVPMPRLETSRCAPKKDPAGKDIDGPWDDALTALDMAALNGTLLLLSLNSAICRRLTVSPIAKRTLLHHAVIGGSLDVVQHVVLLILRVQNSLHPLSANPTFDINARDYRGFNALCLACDLGHLEITKYLAINGCNLKCRTNSGDTPLIISLRRRFRAISNYLLSLECEDVAGTSRYLLCGPNSMNHDGETALHIAASLGDIDSVKRLLDMNADCTPRTLTGETPLHRAALHGHYDIVCALLKAYPKTWSSRAISTGIGIDGRGGIAGNGKCFASIHTCNHRGKTAKDYAMMGTTKGHRDIEKLLNEHEEEINHVEQFKRVVSDDEDVAEDTTYEYYSNS